MSKLPSQITDFLGRHGVLDTILLIVIVLVIQWVLVMALRRNREVLSENRRRWIAAIQNAAIVIVLLGILIIWSPELSTLALSLAAFAVALAITLKEWFLCFVGGLYRVGARPFDTGDWIEVGSHRGEVIYEGLMSFRLMELGHGVQAHLYTGRLLTIPNSRLLTEPVVNETYRKTCMHHTFEITVEQQDQPSLIREFILERIAHYTLNSRDVAARYHSMMRRKIQANIPPVDPTVHVHTTNLTYVVFTVMVFAPTGEVARIESLVTEETLQKIGEIARQSKEGSVS